MSGQTLRPRVVDVEHPGVLQGSTAATAASWTSPWTPQPTIVAVRESRRARNFAATAVAAPVRRAVTLAESITASG